MWVCDAWDYLFSCLVLTPGMYGRYRSSVPTMHMHRMTQSMTRHDRERKNVLVRLGWQCKS